MIANHQVFVPYLCMRDDHNKNMLDRALGRAHAHLGLYLGPASEVRCRPVGLTVSMVQRVAAQVERVCCV